VTRALFVSRTGSDFCDQAFIAAGPQVWNYLLMDLRQMDLSYSCIRWSLKTCLF